MVLLYISIVILVHFYAILSYSYCIPSEFLWYFYRISVAFPLHSYLLLWESNVFLRFPMYFYSIPILFLLYFYCISTCFCCIPVAFLCHVYVFLWYFCGIPMYSLGTSMHLYGLLCISLSFLWCFYHISMAFLCMCIVFLLHFHCISTVCL